MISAVLFFQMEFAKCSARYRSDRPVYFANFEGSSEDEFVTRIVFSGSAGASFL